MNTKIIFWAIALITFSLNSFVINLPQGFCDAKEVASTKNCTLRKIEFASKTPVFLILVHGTFQKSEDFLNGIVFNNDAIPAGFFGDSRYDATQPIRLSFGWTGENSDSARITGGKNLGQGLNEIMQQCGQQGIQPATIVIAHSHGGNVTAVASNFITTPIDYAIFLATPVLRYDQNKKKGTETDAYLPKNIKNLFLFYSMLDMVQTSGALSNDFKRRYGPITGINLYNTRLLLNGQEPDHSTLYTQVIDDHILQLCAKIKQSYTKNRNLVANIAPKNSTVDKIVAIKKYDSTKVSPLTGASTDSLWPNWENFTYTAPEQDENKISDDARTLFNNFYKFEFIDTMPLVDRTIKSAQLELCNRAIGKLGATMGLLPDEQKNDIAKTCCPFDAFKTLHPNATRALACASRPAEPNKTLSPDENKKFCMNVVGAGGRFLSLVTPDIKKDLNKRCCSPEFKAKHPNGSQALGCA